MSRIKIFCPVNPKTGELDKKSVVANAKEFAGFLGWLTQDSQKELRGKAYALIDGKEPTLVAKAMLIDSVAGHYVNQTLVGANRAAAVALSPEAGDYERQSAETIAGRMRGEIKGLKDAIQSEIFEGQLRKSAMTDEAINRLVGAFDGQNLLAKNVAAALAKTLAEESKASQFQLADTVRRYLEAKDRRADVKRLSGSTGSEFDLEKLGLFAPLVRYIETIEQPKARAEMLAHLEDYVRSGWFHKDMVEKATHPGSDLGSWHGAAHEAVLPLREAFSKLEKGQKVADHEIGSLFERRVAELAVGIKTAKRNAKGALHGEDAPWVVTEAFKRDPLSLFSSTAGSAEIDSFWISPDNNQYFITCATSSSTLDMQTDQMSRYLEAIKLCVQSGKLGSFSIPHAPIGIDCRTLALCAGHAAGAKKGPGRQAGFDMAQCFEQGSPAQEAKTMAHLNALPGIALLAAESRFAPENYTYFRFDLIGDKETIWNNQIAAAKAIPGLSAHEQGIAALAGFLGSFGEAMAHQPLKKLALRQKAGGIGAKPYKQLLGLLYTLDKVGEAFSQMGPEQKRALASRLGKGGASLLDNISRIVPKDPRDISFHKDASAKLKSMVDMAEACALGEAAKTKKAPKSPPGQKKA